MPGLSYGDARDIAARVRELETDVEHKRKVIVELTKFGEAEELNGRALRAERDEAMARTRRRTGRTPTTLKP